MLESPDMLSYTTTIQVKRYEQSSAIQKREGGVLFTDSFLIFLAFVFHRSHLHSGRIHTCGAKDVGEGVSQGLFAASQQK